MGISINNLSYGLKDFFEGGGGSASGNTPKDTAKKLAELQQVADRSGQEFESGNVYYDSFDGLNTQSLGQIDLTSVAITTNSSNIINTNDKENLAKLKVGQEVTLVNGQNIARVVIDSIEDGFFTIDTPVTAGMFNGGIATRSMAEIQDGRLVLVPADAPEHDIRYKIIPKNKQPNKIYTWIKHSNPSECSHYDAVITKDAENLFHYSGVKIYDAFINEETFNVVINCVVPETDVKLYLGFDKAPSIDDYDLVMDITDYGDNKLIQIPIDDLSIKVHYKFTCTYPDGTTNDSASQEGIVQLDNCYKYVVRIHKNVSDSKLAVEYIGKSSEVTNWDEVEPFKSIRPVALNATTGAVYGELQPKNYTKLLDGTDLPTSYDVMIEYPRIYWKSVNTETYIDIIISNMKINQEMQAYAHHTGGVDKEKLYVAVYRSYVTSSKARSYYNCTTTYNSLANHRKYAKNKGTGWGLMTWHTWSLVKILFLLRYKTLNSQSICGKGYYSYWGSNESNMATCGLTSGPNGFGSYGFAKLFGLGDIYGNGYTWIDGIVANATGLKIAKDNLATTTYGNVIPITYDTSTTYGRLDDIQGINDYLFYPKKLTDATDSKFYGDYVEKTTSTSYYPFTTAYYGGGSSSSYYANFCGLFGMSCTADSSSSDRYARLIFL